MIQKGKYSKYNRFRFDTGSLALNFVATVRHRGSQPRDLLITSDSLNQWFLFSGLSSAQIEISPKDFRNAILLRESIHDTVYSLISSVKPEENNIVLINRSAKYAIPVPQLSMDICTIELITPDPLMSCLSLIARDAINLIGNTDRYRLKMCGNDSCRMLYTDTSPANRRRWCSMSICGNRAKVALHRKKIKAM